MGYITVKSIRDLDHTKVSCEVSGEYWPAYVNMLDNIPANYPVPALIVDIDYWPASETMDGKPALYCFDLYKPNQWREWLKIGDDNF